MNTILPALVNGFILTVPLAAAVWLALRLSRRSLNAATRYGVWWIALLASMALPMIFLLPSKPHVKPAQAQVRTQMKSDAQPGPSLASPNKALDGALVTQPVLPIPDFRVAPRQSVRVVPSIVPSLPLPVRLPFGTWPARMAELWALVSLLLIARLATSFAILQARKKNADAAPELQKSMERCLAACAVSRRVRIAVVKEGDSPMVAGPIRPYVLIPARLLSALNDTELEQICLHEAAHLARYDDWALLLQRTVEALFVFHPVVRWIARQIDLEREIACDDFVISATGEPRPYASCLTHVAELAVGYSGSPVAAAVVDESSHLTRRINMLLDKTRHTGTHILKLRFAAALLALSLLTWFVGKSPALFALAPQRPVSQSVPVSIRVTVTDPLGRLVTGLEQSNFKVLEDGVEQTISSFDMSDPGSISIKAEVRMQNGVDSLLAAMTGLTAQQVNRRAVVIVFNPSDSLVLPENEVNAIVRDAVETGIVVYTVSVTEDEKTPQQASETSSAGAVLGLLANATGGTQYSASPSFTLTAIEERINTELRNQYAIAYIPKNSTANGVYRRIEVSVTPPAGLPPLTARAIPGYYPKSPSSFAQAAQLPKPAQVAGERPDVASIKPSAVSKDEVIARVNSDAITLGDLDEARAKLRDDTLQDCGGCSEEQVHEKMAPQEKNLLRDLIDNSLLVQRGKDLGVNVETDVIKRLDEIHRPMPEEKEAALRDYLTVLRMNSYVQVKPDYEDTGAVPGGTETIEEVPLTPDTFGT
jgi:beta-lactamase regulating signal transducer with metallopeptidase domain